MSLSPKVIIHEVDNSERISTGCDSLDALLCSGYPAGFVEDRVNRPLIVAPKNTSINVQLINNVYGMKYQYESKGPVISYLAHNPAFNNKKNRTPRGTRKVTAGTKAIDVSDIPSKDSGYELHDFQKQAMQRITGSLGVKSDLLQERNPNLIRSFING